MAHAAAFAGADSTNAHSHGGHAGHHKHVGHHKTADRLPVAAHDHADTGAKCCSMCLVVAHALPAFSSSPVTFTYAAVQFAVAKQTLADHLVPLDPDIPKSLL